MAPQDFIFGVRCPCLACHTYNEVEKYFKYRREKYKKGITKNTLTKKMVGIGLLNKNAGQRTELKNGKLLQKKYTQRNLKNVYRTETEKSLCY